MSFFFFCGRHCVYTVHKFVYSIVRTHTLYAQRSARHDLITLEDTWHVFSPPSYGQMFCTRRVSEMSASKGAGTQRLAATISYRALLSVHFILVIAELVKLC